MKRLLRRIQNRLRFEASTFHHRLAIAFWALPSIRLEELAPRKDPLVPPITDDICLPPFIGAGDHDDFEPLMRLVQEFQPKIVFELGTAHGNTVANICKQCPQAKVYTVNALPERQTGVLDTFKLEKEAIGRAYRKHGYGDRVEQIFENTLNLDLSNYFSSPVIDLGIVDACHDTKYVINDFLKLQPFVRKGGIILLHDTNPSLGGHLRASYVGCVTLRSKGYDVRHLADTWWAVWVNR